MPLGTWVPDADLLIQIHMHVSSGNELHSQNDVKGHAIEIFLLMIPNVAKYDPFSSGFQEVQYYAMPVVKQASLPTGFLVSQNCMLRINLPR